MPPESKTCRVLMVGQLPPPTGGVTEQVRLLVGSRLKDSVTLDHLSPRRDPSCRGLGRILNSLGLVVRTLIRALRIRPDIAHLHTSSHFGFHEKALLAELLRLCGVRVVLHLHGGGFAEFYAASRLKVWIRRALERAGVVLALSSGWRDYLQSIAPRARVEVFSNSIDPMEYASANETARSDRTTQAPRIAFLGALVRAKGVYKIPDLARRFEPGEVVFDVVGDGPEAGALAAALRQMGLEDRVHLHGALHGAAKRAVLEHAKVFLLPSDVEGQPVSILEAMAAGAAVVGTDVGGVPEMLADGRGVVCGRDELTSMAGAIRRLLNDEAGRRRMVSTARDYVRQHHELPAQVRRLIAIYERLRGDTSPGEVFQECPAGGAR